MAVRLAFVCIVTIPSVSAATDRDVGPLIEFDIPQQRADRALTEFARQANRTLVFPFNVARRTVANRLVGTFSVEEALERLLAGTDLEIEIGEAGQLNVVSDEHPEGTAVSNEANSSLTKRLITAISAAIFGGGASAATTHEQPAVEEIVVTAQKRETALQETPIAITALTSERIERDQIRDFRDVATHTPSMTFTQLAGNAQIAMRGVGLDLTNLAAETSVALYEDGVYRGASFIQGAPSFDIERIEILRGPQGTLYGRNATAGAANIVSKQPHETGELNASVTGGDYDYRRAELGFSGPIVPDLLAGRGSFIYEDRDGYRDNKTLGIDEDAMDLKGTRGALFFTPTEELELVLRGDYAEFDTSGGLQILLQESPTPLGLTPTNVGGFLTLPNPALGGASLADVFGLTFPQATEPVILDSDDLDVFTDQHSNQKVEQKGVSGTVTWDLEAVTAKLIAAYRESDFDLVGDTDGTSVQMLAGQFRQTSDQTTYELNLSGALWDNRVDWLIGAYYFQEDGFARGFFDLGALQTTFEAIFGLFSPLQAPLPPGSLAAFGTRLKTGQPSATPFLDFVMEQDSESSAVFGQSTINLVEALRLTLGARYTEDKKDVHREGANNLGGTPCSSDENESWNETTGTAIVDYTFAEDTMVYGSLSKGYKAGGFNISECAGAFDPETLLAYEIGVKTQVADSRVQLNGAVFLYEYDDIQVNRFVNTSSSITNAAEADILGAELEFVVLLTDRLSFDGGVTWLDSEYGGGATFSNPILGGAPISVDGNDLMRTPEWKLYVAAQYEWETSIGRFTARADTAYSASFYFDVFEASLPDQSEMEQDSYTISNARLAWESLDGVYEVQGFIENIGDEIYAETRQALGATGAVFGEFSAPRRYGVRVSARFGN
jgi:iron complex outermembrane receptor protein